MKDNVDQIVEEALRSEPRFKLNQDFRNRVFNAIRKKESRFQRKVYFLLALGVVGMIAMGIITISYFFPGIIKTNVLSSGTSAVDSLVPMAILIGIMLVFIQFLDKRLIKDRYLSH